MRSAPAVRIEVGHDPSWQVATAVLGGAAGAALAGWAASWLDAGAAVALLAAAVAAPGAAVAGRRLLAVDAGVLQWDTQAWTWADARRTAHAQGGEPRVVIDLGPWMLLRFDADPPPRRRAWLALSKRSAGGHWHAWRTAVYSRRPEPEGDSAPRI